MKGNGPPRRRSLLSRIAVSFFLLSFLMALVLTAVSVVFSVRSAMERVTEQMNGIADTKVQALEQWVEERESDVAVLADLREVQADGRILCSLNSSSVARAAGEDLLGLLTSLTPQDKELAEVMVVTDDGGRVVFSTDPSSVGQYRTLETFFTEGRNATYVGSVGTSPDNLQPTLTISTPIRSVNGDPIGVLAANLDLDTMDKVAEDRTGLGSGGEAYLVDRYNVFVSSRRFVPGEYPRGVHSVGIDAAVSGHNGTGVYMNYAGVPVIGDYTWIPDRQAALILEIPQSQAFLPVENQALILALIGLGMTLVAAASVYLLSRRIVAPLLAVRLAALRVSSGDLDAQAPELARDEIGELARAFNFMTTRVKELYDEIRKNEAHFRALIENSSDIVTVSDDQPRFRFVSPSVQRVLGYRPEELVGIDPLQLVHPEDIEKVRETGSHIRDAAGDKPVTLSFRMGAKNGSWRTLETTWRNLLAHPAIGGIVVVGRDVTEQLQLEEKLHQAMKMEAVGRLAGGIAHDFNNLLTAVLGYSELLLEEPSLMQEARGNVEEIKKAATRAASLTQQLLAYSRKQMLQPKIVDLDLLVANLQNMLRRLIGEDIELVVKPGDGRHDVKADPSQVEQVVLNFGAQCARRDAHGRLDRV